MKKTKVLSFTFLNDPRCPTFVQFSWKVAHFAEKYKNVRQYSCNVKINQKIKNCTFGTVESEVSKSIMQKTFLCKRKQLLCLAFFFFRIWIELKFSRNYFCFIQMHMKNSLCTVHRRRRLDHFRQYNRRADTCTMPILGIACVGI
jgi:hypothetical protein